MKQILLLISVLLSCVCFAQIPDPLPNTYINDIAGVLQPEQTKNLNEQIAVIEKTFSVQIAVLLIDKLPDGISIEDYTLQVGRKWHVGNAKNGLVYVVSVSQHKQRLEVADNLQGTISDINANKLLDLTKQYYRQSDYYDGVRVLIEGVNIILTPVKEEQQALGAAELSKKESSGNGEIWLFIITGLTGIGGLFWITKRGNKKKTKQKSRETKIEQTQYRYPIYTPISSKSKLSGEDFGSGFATGYLANDLLNSSKDSSSYSSPSSYSSNDDSSSSSSSSSWGDWGSGSSDSSSSSDSGFSGGGSSSDW